MLNARKHISCDSPQFGRVHYSIAIQESIREFFTPPFCYNRSPKDERARTRKQAVAESRTRLAGGNGLAFGHRAKSTQKEAFL